MVTFHQKKLQSIQDKMNLLQEEKLKSEQALATSILKALQSKNALSLNMDTLIGGIFSLIDKIQHNDPETEQWSKKGQQFFKRKANKVVSVKNITDDKEKKKDETKEKN